MNPPQAKKPNRHAKVYIDGASRGNPGRAAAGVVFYDQQGTLIEEVGRYLGETTNNVAEYQGLLLALQRAQALGIRSLEIFSDSQLLTKQLNGHYQVKSPHLLPLYRQVKQLMQAFEYVTIRYVPRTANQRADRVANRALEEGLK
ncbi:MAG: reverse transcriptase-like protein [Nitrospinota bacterium]|nr:MAG: reverse transcriptase-like protein [Nitrospinota bacterium]